MGNDKLSSNSTHSFFQNTTIPTPSFTTYKNIPKKNPSIGRALTLIHSIISTALLSQHINLRNSADILHYKLAFFIMSTPQNRLLSPNITSLIYKRLILLLGGKIPELLELSKPLLTPTSKVLLDQDTQILNMLKTATSLAKQGHCRRRSLLWSLNYHLRILPTAPREHSSTNIMTPAPPSPMPSPSL
jgi:hypothetical protein